MTSAEFIRRIQEIDPAGTMEVALLIEHPRRIETIVQMDEDTQQYYWNYGAEPLLAPFVGIQ